MRIFVMRHGRTGFNEQGLINGFLDDPLSDEGRLQARQAATQIPATVTNVYASPLLRTKETAELVNETLQAPVSFHDELKEVNFGELSGTPFLPEIREKHEQQQYDWRMCGGECVDDVRARVLTFLENIRDKHDDGEVLIVTHGGIIRMLYLLEHGKTVGRIENASVHEFNLENILARLSPSA